MERGSSGLERPLRLALAWLGLTTGWLGGCAHSPEPSLPPPVPEVAVPPALEATAAEWVLAYREVHGVPGFDLVPLPDSAGIDAARSGEAELALTLLEPPEGWFAVPLALDAVAIVVHPSNPVRDLSLSDLADLFTGRIADWSALGGDETPVQPVLLPPGDSLRLRFDSFVLGDSRPWPGSWLAPTPEAVMTLVEGDRGAIGYLPLSQVQESLRIVRIDGLLPGQDQLSEGKYPLAFTILAAAPREPSGAIRDWLAWLQATRLPAP